MTPQNLPKHVVKQQVELELSILLKRIEAEDRALAALEQAMGCLKVIDPGSPLEAVAQIARAIGGIIEGQAIVIGLEKEFQTARAEELQKYVKQLDSPIIPASRN